MNHDDHKHYMLNYLGIEKEKHDYFDYRCASIVYDKLSNLVSKHKDDKIFLHILNDMLVESGNKPVTRLDKFKLYIENGNEIMCFDGEKFVTDRKEELIGYGLDLDKHLFFNRRTEFLDYDITLFEAIANHYGYKIDLQGPMNKQYYVVEDCLDPSFYEI